ncbi:AfsR/SARP family transcriptional regulator [Saccharothrix longispora]|uniref:AfsR/SARP family transcriptional regulator n=1 Tax=Saccharothrix longispora TaxID=33920 RepID=UPI002905B6A6|nr:BTAD domain-containing putative transcriptional regulator [Saccharothrix longispora]MBY8850443.1 tetratricopeptide repeat protein [Saccharothrix sp. MB29]
MITDERSVVGELRVLGPVEARAGDRRLDVGHARQQCVLAALLVDANRVVTADQLLDRVWGARVPLRGKSNLHSYVSRLRAALADLGDVAIVHRSGGWVLEVDPARVDLHRFRDLLARARSAPEPAAGLGAIDEALGLWRGEAFSGLDTPWVVAARDMVDGERWIAELERTDLALRLGRHTDLLPELAARTAEHPLDERVAAQYLLALARGGRQAEALAHYERVRSRLAEELGADPGAALRDLHRRLLDAEPVGTGGTVKPAVPQPAAVVPRQLPAPPRSFIGRAGELAALTAALDDVDAGTVVISAIGGTGGIGKTWLALHWAHQHAHRFPDGQLFVDLRGFSPESEPMPPAVAVRGFLDALGVEPGRMPSGPDAQTALLRGMVADRRMLIVLDNAASAAQVVPLLPGGRSCTVLVTSRSRLLSLTTAHGAGHLNLDVLSRDESRDLLARRLGADRVAAEARAVDELIALCNGFPLALGVIAARAYAHPRLPLATFAAELRDLGLDALADSDPAASLPTVLSWSHQALTAEEREVFGLLGIAPGPDIALPAAAALTGLSPARAGTALRGLEQASLLTRDDRGRYAMHDLIRAYAAGTARGLPDSARRRALRRVVDFYLHTTHAADRLLDPHRELVEPDPAEPGGEPQPLADTAEALAWLDTEHRCVLAAQQSAAAGGQHRAVWQLAWNLTTFHNRRGHLEEQLSVWRSGLVAAGQLDDPAAGIRVHRNLGRSHAALRQHDEAVRHLHQALALAEEHDPTNQAHIHQVLAWTWSRGGDDGKALDHATRALDLYRTLGNPAWEANALNMVGWYAAQLGQHDRAREHCRAALDLHRRHDNPEGEADTLDSLGYIDHHTGEHAPAVEHYRRALVLFREIGNTYQVADTLEHLGHPHAALGQVDDARAAWREALEFYEAQDRPDDTARIQALLDGLATGGPATA